MPYKDPAKKKAYQRLYYQNHKEKMNAKSKAWRNANLEHEKAICKVWREQNPEYRKAYHKVYYQANSDKIKLRAKTWREANPDKSRDAKQKYRAFKHRVPYEPINDKKVFIRDGWKCQHCKKRVDKKLKHPDAMSASLDHIIPLNKNGTHTYNNVQLAHFVCNISKKDSILSQGEQLRMF